MGEVLKHTGESFRISKYETQSGTYHANLIFSPRLVPSRFRENLTPAQQEFLARKQNMFISNLGIPRNQEIKIFNCPSTVQISISNFEISKRGPRSSN